MSDRLIVFIAGAIACALFLVAGTGVMFYLWSERVALEPGTTRSISSLSSELSSEPTDAEEAVRTTEATPTMARAIQGPEPATPTLIVLPTPTPVAPLEPTRAIDPDGVLAKMRQHVDGVDGSIIYYAKDAIEGPDAFKDDDSIFLAIVQVAGQLHLYLRVRYTGEGWIFVRSYTIRAGNEVFSLRPSTEVDRDVVYGSTVSEIGIIAIGEAELPIIKAMLDADYVIVRQNGESSRDFFLRTSTKQQMRDTLDAYQALGGPSVVSRDTWPLPPAGELRAQIVGKWKELAGGDIWTFELDGAMRRGDRAGRYHIAENGTITYRFDDASISIERRVEIYDDQMFLVNESSSSGFAHFQREPG